MQLPLSATLGTLIVLDETGSTNEEMIERHSMAADFTVVATASQTAGRGRLGRVWVAPPGKTLAASVLVRPVLPGGRPLGMDSFGWLPLIAGVAMARSIRALVPGRATTLKWPNDVLIDGRKVCGILAELLPGGTALVIGTGVNLSLTEAELPVPTATSLLLAGAEIEGDHLADAVLSGYLRSMRELLPSFSEAGGDGSASGILDLVSEACRTLGQDVRVELPGGANLFGVATGIDATGRLVVRRSSDGQVQAVAAGDVTHLRYE
jgi:BirA family biotin operon repressor/biotin-[acetyl-CoA-carboxylase] ligase